MIDLVDGIKKGQSLEEILSTNGISHREYKYYSSMENALGLLLSGELYLSSGSNWNDVDDRKLMSEKCCYAKCFSYSTSENIAMWMLYSGNRGKNGAMLSFPKGVILRMLKSPFLEIGNFTSKGFEVFKTIDDKNDFTIKMSDMIYFEECSNHEKVKLTCNESHITTDIALLREVRFKKRYPWQYEKECRMVIEFSDRIKHELKQLKDEDRPRFARIHIEERDLRELRKRLVKSPVYSGDCSFGNISELTNTIQW